MTIDLTTLSRHILSTLAGAMTAERERQAAIAESAIATASQTADGVDAGLWAEDTTEATVAAARAAWGEAYDTFARLSEAAGLRPYARAMADVDNGWADDLRNARHTREHAAEARARRAAEV